MSILPGLAVEGEGEVLEACNDSGDGWESDAN